MNLFVLKNIFLGFLAIVPARFLKPVLQVILLLAVFFVFGMYLASMCFANAIDNLFKLLFIMFVLSKMLTYSVILKFVEHALWNIPWGIDLKFLYCH